MKTFRLTRRKKKWYSLVRAIEGAVHPTACSCSLSACSFGIIGLGKLCSDPAHVVCMKQNAKSAIFTRENGKRLLRQLLLLLPAWIVLALGIAMSVFSGVGSDTNTSFQQGLGRMLGLQTGTVTLIFNCTVLAIFIFANRSLVGLGSLVIGFGLGPLLNLYLDLLGKIFPTMPPMWARIALCTLGVVIACIALGWYVQLDAGVQPMDMLILTVAKLIRKSYGTAMYVYCGFMLLTTWLTGGDIGVGTFINLLLGGKLCDVFAAMWRPLIRRLGVGSKKEETT